MHPVVTHSCPAATSIRPGRPTQEYLDRVMTRITFVGALYLIVISLIPQFMISGIHFQNLPFVGGLFAQPPVLQIGGKAQNRAQLVRRKVIDREEMASEKAGGWRGGIHMLYIFAYSE